MEHWNDGTKRHGISARNEVTTRRRHAGTLERGDVGIRRRDEETSTMTGCRCGMGWERHWSDTEIRGVKESSGMRGEADWSDAGAGERD